MLGSTIERAQDFYFQKVWGITREYPELRWSGATGFMLYAKLHESKHHPEIRGKLPPVGTGAILTANHAEEDDSINAVIACMRNGRFIQCFARDTLMNLSLKEDPKVLADTGKEENDLDHNPLWKRHLRAKFLKDVGARPIRRGSNFQMDTMRFGLKRLDSGILMASFLNRTRIESGDLQDLFEGAAFLACQRPDVLVVPIGNSYNPDVFNIGEWYTYRQAKSKSGFEIDELKEPQNMTINIADHVAPLLPAEKKDRWFDLQRDIEINRFRRGNEIQAAERAQRLQAKKAAYHSEHTNLP